MTQSPSAAPGPFYAAHLDDLPIYRFALLDAFSEIQHAVLTRCGGISPPPYDSLNLSFSVGDAAGNVQANRRRVRESLGFEELLSVGQTHGDNALILTDRDPRPGAAEMQGIDILITNIPGLGLMIKQADCQAVMLYDPRHRAVANIHCGWRGNVQNVLGQGVTLLAQTFNSRPEDLRAAVSPSLGPCCAEFVHYQQEWPPTFWHYQVKEHYFDLWHLSRDQLLAAGLLPGHIHLAGVCTRCAARDFFSYRREGRTGRTGRNASVIGLLPETARA